jgi:hypothetical protein
MLTIILQLERFHPDVPQGLEEYVKPDMENNGYDGLVDISLPWEPENKILLDAAVELGVARNLDVNSGDPIGAGLSAVTCHSAMRTTSASASLNPQLPT